MQESAQKQPRGRVLPALSVDVRPRVKDVDINEVVKTVQDVLPRYVEGNIDTTITLLEKNLEITDDGVLLREALTDLVKDAIGAISGYGRLSLPSDQISFEIESLLDADDPLIGACDFVSLPGGTEVYVDKRMKERVFEPFFTTRRVGNDVKLAVAYRIIKQHHDERIRPGSRREQNIEVNIYLPLTKVELVNMMSIPAG
jgi:nitrogen fixation/metabolism regulation signal transduction histidine kinase